MKENIYLPDSDGTNMWLVCSKHGIFGCTPPKYWNDEEVKRLIQEHEAEYHAA